MGRVGVLSPTVLVPARRWGWRRRVWALMNAVERALAALALVLLAPLLLVVGAAVFAQSRRPPLVRHGRIGQHGAPFSMLKFRTMWNGRPAEGWQFGLAETVTDEAGPDLKRSDDPRIGSRLARCLRTYSVDELPQLAHVLSGRMSLVGPRPLTRSELERHYGAAARDLLSLRPGVTGLWQVLGRSRLTLAQRRRLDLFYLRKRSVLFDLWILARTIPRVLGGKDSW